MPEATTAIEQLCQQAQENPALAYGIQIFVAMAKAKAAEKEQKTQKT